MQNEKIAPQWYLDKAQEYLPETIKLRRHLHQYPELSFEEHDTADFIEKSLNNYGIKTERLTPTGVIALIEGLPGDKKLALRADIDALPIHEEGRHDYLSRNTGVMHACGHDVHTASLLTTARILYETRSSWQGNIKLIFQPAEEKFPGGASILIKHGILDDPPVQSILGQHVFPELAAGKLGFRPGPFMASADELYITVKGKTGHGAMPHLTRDAILIASHMVVALQQVVSRNNNPLTPTVLSIGKIQSMGGATNIIPGEVRLEGTFRTFDETWRKEAKTIIKKICEGIAESMGGTVDVDIKDGYPVLFNDPGLTEEIKNWAIELLGVDNIVDLPMRTTAEDFAYYSQRIPACFYRLGTAYEGHEGDKKIHTPDFDINELAQKTGVGFMAFAATRYMQ